jgi:hypothetical protein
MTQAESADQPALGPDWQEGQLLLVLDATKYNDPDDPRGGNSVCVSPSLINDPAPIPSD